jgi:hypothetical protein
LGSSSRVPRRTFIAFSRDQLAISASACFHDDSNATPEEVHMKFDSADGQKQMLCAPAAAGFRALLG